MTKTPANKTAKTTSRTGKVAKKPARNAKTAPASMETILEETLGYLGLLSPQLRDQYPAIAEIKENLSEYDKAGLEIGRCFSPALKPGDCAGTVYVTKNERGRYLILGGIALYSDGFNAVLDQAMYSYHLNHRTSIDDIASLKGDQNWDVDENGVPFSTKDSTSQDLRKAHTKLLSVASDYDINTADFFIPDTDNFPLVNMMFKKAGNGYRLVGSLYERDGRLDARVHGSDAFGHANNINRAQDISALQSYVERILQAAGKVLNGKLSAEIAKKLGTNPDVETYVWANPVTREWMANTRTTYLYSDEIKWGSTTRLGTGDEPNTDGLTNIKYALPPEDTIAHSTSNAEMLSGMLKDYIAQFEERMAKVRLDPAGQILVNDIVLDMERGLRTVKTAENLHPYDLMPMPMHPMMRRHPFMGPGKSYYDRDDRYGDGSFRQ